MVSFRFHLVSLIGVFLALGVGIAVGASVVDQATVKVIRDQLHRVDNRRRATDTQNDALRRDLKRWTEFGDQATDQLVQGHLTGAPVLVVAVEGSSRDVVTHLNEALGLAGARLQGTVWLTAKLNLDPKKPDDGQSLAAILEAPPAAPEALRTALVARLANAWVDRRSESPLPALRLAGFADYSAPPAPAVDPATVPGPGTRFVVVSQGEALVPNDQLAAPLTAALARSAPGRVLAAEAGRDPVGRDPGERAAFVAFVRDDPQLSPAVSTVDDLEDPKGRVAAVYALEELSRGKAGHYGVGPKASRLLPEPVTP